MGVEASGRDGRHGPADPQPAVRAGADLDGAGPPGEPALVDQQGLPGRAHAVVQQMLKAVADGGERNAAFVVKMAAAEMEDAHEALAELISERNVRGEPLGPALATYVNMISHNGPAPVRLPEGRRRDSFVGDFVIVRLLIDLKAQFIGLKLRRSGSKRPSACSIVSAALIEMGLSRGSEEAIRKIWERYGPPTIPSYRRPPPPGVVRFTSRDM